MRQINKEIAEDAAYDEADQREAIAYGVGLMIGGAAMEDRYSLGYLGLCVEIAPHGWRCRRKGVLGAHGARIRPTGCKPGPSGPTGAAVIDGPERIVNT